MEKIRTYLHNSGDDYININIPIISDSSDAGRSDVIERDYVQRELEEVIGVPYDNEKYQATPYFKNSLINKMVFKVNLNENGNYISKLSDFGFENDDIKFNRNVFKHSMLSFELYDEPDDLKNILVVDHAMKLKINQDDYLRRPNNFIYGLKDVEIIDLKLETYNPKYYTFLNNEGYFLYLEKKEFGTKLNPKYLYMKCQFKNAKNGYIHYLGTKNENLAPNEISKSRFMRIKLFNDNGNFVFEYDNEFSDNISQDGDNLIVNLYETIGN